MEILKGNQNKRIYNYVIELKMELEKHKEQLHYKEELENITGKDLETIENLETTGKKLTTLAILNDMSEIINLENIIYKTLMADKLYIRESLTRSKQIKRAILFSNKNRAYNLALEIYVLWYKSNKLKETNKEISNLFSMFTNKSNKKSNNQKVLKESITILDILNDHTYFMFDMSNVQINLPNYHKILQGNYKEDLDKLNTISIYKNIKKDSMFCEYKTTYDLLKPININYDSKIQKENSHLSEIELVIDMQLQLLEIVHQITIAELFYNKEKKVIITKHLKSITYVCNELEDIEQLQILDESLDNYNRLVICHKLITEMYLDLVNYKGTENNKLSHNIENIINNISTDIESIKKINTTIEPIAKHNEKVLSKLNNN